MASLRNTGRGLTALLRNQQQQAARRGISTRAGSRAYMRPVLVGACAAAATYGIYTHYKDQKWMPTIDISATPVVHAAEGGLPTQPSVVSGTKDHALYLWIHLTSEADAKECLRIACSLQDYVDAVCPPDMRDEDDEVIAGVGFGPGFYNKAAKKTSFFGFFQSDGPVGAQPFDYHTRSGENGDMPAEGGDIFIHAKCNQISKLFELSKMFMANLPDGSVAKFEDNYGWVFQNGRDLSGFIDGTENPADDESRYDVACEKKTGGSYVITQRWVHNLEKIKKTKAPVLESFVGRQIDDSTELKDKTIASHVARMTGGNKFEQKKEFEIVRQSQPYGTVSGKAGLFFIAYSASTKNFDFMLDRMVGKGEDTHCDDIMRLTTCESTHYWYFPSITQLKDLKNKK